MDDDTKEKFHNHECVFREMSVRLRELAKKVDTLDNFVRNELAPRVNENAIE